jgi:general secretion pathway protein G
MNLMEVVIVIAIILVVVSVLGIAANKVWQDSRVSSTRLQIGQVGTTVSSYMHLVNNGKPPASLKEVDLEGQTTDSWGNEFDFITPGPNGTPFDIVSYGSDGQEGGVGRAQDIRFSDS